MSDLDEEEDRKRKKKEKPKEPDKSTPELADPSLFLWIENLFQANERAESIKVLRVWGRREIDPTPVHSYLFPVGEKPTKEDLVKVTNDAMEAMQNDANVTRTSMLYEVNAFNAKKGAGAFATRRVRIDPIRFLTDGREGREDDEEGTFPTLQESSRKHAVEAWSDAREYVDKAIQTLGGLVHVQAEQLREKDRHIERLFDLKMKLSEQADNAQNHALDREVIREKEKFNLELKRQGMAMLQGFLLPEAGKIAKTMFNHENNKEGKSPTITATATETSSSSQQQQAPPVKSLEGEVIERVTSSLSEEENVRIFGDWQEGNLIKKGILTEMQVKIFAGVAGGVLGPEALDTLIPGQTNEITTQQGLAIVGVADMAKLRDLLEVLQKRREKFESKVPPPAPK